MIKSATSIGSSNTGLLSTGSPYNGSGAQLYGGGTQGIGAEVTAGTYGVGLKVTGGIGNTAIQAIAGTSGSALQTMGSYQNLASGLYDIGSISNPFHKAYLANEVTCSGIIGIAGGVPITQEGWTAINPAGGAAPAFSTNWSNAGGSNEICQFFKDSCGIVHVTGMATNTTAGSATIFSLPAGYRPLNTVSVATTANGAFGILTVTSAGAMGVGGVNVNISMHISFKAEQ